MSEQNGSEPNGAVLAVARMVRERMDDNGGDQKKAIRTVAKELKPNRPAKVRDLWDEGLGYFAVWSATSDTFRQRPPTRYTEPDTDDGDTGKKALPDNWGTSRWDWDGDVGPYDVHVAIGNTGEWKALGDFTREDLLTTANFRQRQGRTLVRQGEALKTVAMKIPEDDVLRNAHPNLSKPERDVIEEIAGASFGGESEASIAAD